MEYVFVNKLAIYIKKKTVKSNGVMPKMMMMFKMTINLNVLCAFISIPIFYFKCLFIKACSVSIGNLYNNLT